MAIPNMKSLGRVFTTSIPKSGTHFLTEFYRHAELSRKTISDSELRRVCGMIYLSQNRTPNCVEITEEEVRFAKKSLRPELVDFRSALSSTPTGKHIYNHYPHHPALATVVRECEVPGVLLYRDPRDVVVSLVNHLMRHPEHKHHALMQKLPDAEQRYIAVIRGGDWDNEKTKYLNPLPALFDRFAGWLSEQGFLSLRFEDIIGAAGGGDEDSQAEAFEQLISHIGLEASSDSIRAWARKSYSQDATMFVRGRIGQWKEEFSPRVHRAVETYLGSVLTKWGYE